MNYVHGGDYGDIIYFLPVAKYNAPSRLWLNAFPYVRALCTREHADNILPLLNSQDYLTASYYEGEVITGLIDANLWRLTPHYHSHLCYRQCEYHGTPLEATVDPWLKVEPNRVASTVINRTARYHGGLDYKPYLDNAVFIGSTEEHSAFVFTFGFVPYYRTRSLLEAAMVIAGADLFVGNQSACYALAEGLKQCTVQEVYHSDPNCVFVRDNAKYV